MAANDPIRPFPADIDRDAFGHWISGFVDGEGCFILGWRNDGKDNKNRTGQAQFAVNLRADDTEILRSIRDYWAVGKVADPKPGKIGHPQSKYAAWRIRDLFSVIMPHFERYPLRSKKRRDFNIWSEGIRLLYSIRQRPMRKRPGRTGSLPKWTGEDLARYESLFLLLKSQREFGVGTITISSAAIAPPQYPLFDSNGHP